MITQKQYIEYLLSTPITYTCANLAEHLENISHDAITDFLHNSAFAPQDLWAVVKDRLADSPEAYLLVDDSVQNKRYSQVIETVKLQYSGTEHSLVKGIGLVNLVHTDGLQSHTYPIDYRVYDPDPDQTTKNEHFREMFRAAHADKQLQTRRIAFDSWYAGAELKREYEYLYGLIEPLTGESFILELPALEGALREVFLAEFGKTDETSLHLVLLDNAAAHTTAKLKVAANIKFIYLPPYAPELNPAERFWKELKDWLSDYEPQSLSEVSQLVTPGLKSFSAEVISSLTSCDWLIKAWKEAIA